MAPETPRRTALDIEDGLRPSDYIKLEPYEEICGQLEELNREDNHMLIALSSGTLRYRADSAEAAICARELEGFEGEYVAILRTQSIEHPIRVRRMVE